MEIIKIWFRPYYSFSSNPNVHNHVSFVFGLKNKGRMNFYELCDLIQHQHQTPPSNSLIYKIQKIVDHNSNFRRCQLM